MSMAHAAGAMRDPVLFRLGPRTHLTLLHFDLAVITLWFMVTAVQFKFDELLLYPMALYFTYALFRDRHATWPVLRRGFVLLLFPGWWLTSVLWSPDISLTLKFGIQITLTILICIFMASRLNARLLLTVIVIAMTVIALRSLPLALSDLARGAPSKAIYPHKNALGVDMSVLLVAALALLFIPSIPVLIRRLALAILPVALVLVFASKSGTAILTTIGMVGVVLAPMAYLGHKNRLTFGRVSALAFTCAAALIALVLILNLAPVDPVTLVLDALGKDRSLTGRTHLWAIAKNEIAERPLLGVGAKGYWRYEESAFIRQIFIDYYKGPRNIFHFHNSWLQIGVDLGLIGVFFAASALGWALFVLARRAILLGGPENWALLAIGLTIFVQTMTESALFSQFALLYMLLWTGALIPDRLLSQA